MAGLVILFFVSSTAITILVGAVFSSREPRPMKLFGIGLVATGLAFGVWTIAVITKPKGMLAAWVTVGVLIFLLALLLFALVWMSELQGQLRVAALAATFVWVIAVIVLRVAYPSHPGFSKNGLFLFNPHGSVAAFEIFGLVAAALPATFRVSRHLKPRDAMVAKLAFTTLVVGGIILITSHDEVLLTFDGWGMGLATLGLLSSFVLRRPARWQTDRKPPV